jgi:DNA-binding CsgD family transcriptional regulator
MDGQSTKEIAVHLSIHPRTVFIHIAAQRQALGARSRALVVSYTSKMCIVRSVKLF